MPVGGPGPVQLRDLSLRLREMGKEGKGLQRELYRAINKSVKPFSVEISSAEYLKPYMPDRFAEVLGGDLRVTAMKRGGQRASVSIRVKGRQHKRQVQMLNAGLLRHPVFAERGTPRSTWNWVTQTKAMRSGFFSDAAHRAAPGIRAEVQKAIDDVGKKITS
jgi:hypothetical protein